MSPFLVLPRALTKPLRWPADSVRRARHNAFAANAVLAVRRAEREEVARFLDDRDVEASAPRDAFEPVPTPRPRPR
ncbi:hypothetical protein [Nocardioides sp. Iso805N]|uniref:hypothetical protein n=1 Tax=Nocardioides sp. Iso805N TaxID=1283287 RepID=UPI000366FA3D|nr:hypothetical protein [Nocardioides sp. Iso805N]